MSSWYIVLKSGFFQLWSLKWGLSFVYVDNVAISSLCLDTIAGVAVCSFTVALLCCSASLIHKLITLQPEHSYWQKTMKGFNLFIVLNLTCYHASLFSVLSDSCFLMSIVQSLCPACFILLFSVLSKGSQPCWSSQNMQCGWAECVYEIRTYHIDKHIYYRDNFYFHHKCGACLSCSNEFKVVT